MRVSKKGNAVYLDVGIWYDAGKGVIHMTAKGLEEFHTTVSDDPKSVRGHPNLFMKLAKCLAQNGAPHPQINGTEEPEDG